MQSALVQQQGVRPQAFKSTQRGASISKRGAQLCRPSSVLRVAAEDAAVSTVASTVEAAPCPTALGIDEIQELIKLVHTTDIASFEIKGKHFHLSLKTQEAIIAEQGPVQVIHSSAAPAVAAAPAAPPPPTAAAAAAPPPPPKAEAALKVEGVEMTSPMAGTFYRAPAPGEPMFVKEGDRITKGQTIGIIEAMKLMNEIEAEMSGEFVKFVVDNGASVNPGQPLAIIKP